MPIRTEALTEKLITAEQLAEILGVTRRRVWDMASMNKISGGFKVGASWRFRLSDVMEAMENGNGSGDGKKK